jgi:mono/diheme cytochrome c family protein
MTRPTILLALALLPGCRPDPAPPPAEILERGRAAFGAYCAACHHPDGLGVEGGGPPLAASPWVSGPESRLIRIVLQGVRGPIGAGGAVTNREMLGFGPILSDGELAPLLTYVRQRFGPAPPVTPAAVASERERTRDRTDYWTVEELLRD